MSTLTYAVVDAFTATPFAGNPAAVIVLDPHAPALSDATLQAVAAEFNLSETAFATPTDDDGGYALRWFTPTHEVALCGHATLATAAVLLAARPAGAAPLAFATKSGVLTAVRGADGRIELELPAGTTARADAALHRRVADVVRRAFAASAPPTVRFVGTGAGVAFGTYMLVHVDGPDLAGAAVQAGVFGELAPAHAVVMVTQAGRAAGETFASRVFAPAMGVAEDPVTGSAHCMLGPYWAQTLGLGDGAAMRARQGGARAGEVGVEWDRGRGTCRLRGHATLVARGELYLPSV